MGLTLQETKAEQAEWALSDHKVPMGIHHVTRLERWVAFRPSSLLATECLQFSSSGQDVENPERTDTSASGEAALAPSPTGTKVGASPHPRSRQEAQSRARATECSHLSPAKEVSSEKHPEANPPTGFLTAF